MKISDLKFLRVRIEKHPSTDIQLEYLEHHNAVAVLILNAKGDKSLLVEQYRPGNRGNVFEIPAGLIDKGENPLEAMYREVEEETGYVKENFNELYKSEGPLLISPGYTSEKLNFYILQLKDDSIQPKAPKFDIGEDLVSHWIDIDKIKTISNDLKTQYSLNLYYLLNKN